MADPHENGTGGVEEEKKKDKNPCHLLFLNKATQRENAANNLTLFRCYVNLVQLSTTLMLARIMENGSVGFGCTQRAIILPYVII